MTIFISYSHENKNFVDLLATHLVKNKAHVWVDTWELKVGDSLIQKVQEALTDSSALLVILSKSSVESEWCKKELSAGLIRELEEKKVVVLPVLYEDCNIPLFLKDKMYADFRNDFESGLISVLEAVAVVTNQNLGRITNTGTHIDWSMDWYYIDNLFQIKFTLVEHSIKYPYSVLIEILILCNENATFRYKQYEENNLDWVGRAIIIESLGSLIKNDSFHLILEDQFPVENNTEIRDSKRGISFKVKIRAQRLGEDNGKDIVVNVGNYLEMIRSHIQETCRNLSQEEQVRMFELIKKSF